MTDDTRDTAWIAVQGALLDDADDDVTATDDALDVKGVRFAFRDGDALVVDLPESRARDLVDRDVASSHDAPDARGRWVAVSDAADWLEMATEAHQFVGEPAVGRDS